MSKEKKLITGISLVICFLLAFIYCFAPLCVGINAGGINSDVEKSIGISGINNGNFYVKYAIENAESQQQLNSFSSFVRTVVGLVRNFTPVFDARILAFIYLVLLLVSVFYVNKYIDMGNMVGNIILAAAYIFIFFDLSYLLYLNSLFAEAAFFAFFMFALSLYVKLICSEKPQFPTTIFFILTCIIICGLKPGFYLLAYVFSGLAIYLWFKRKGYLYRITLALLIVLMLIYPLFRYKTFSDSETNKFNSLFYGVLYEQENPEKILNKLGINEKYAELAGKNTFEQLPDYVTKEEFKNDIYNKISAKKLLFYYLLNPSDYISQYKYVGFNSLETYPKYVGNYTYESGKSFDEKIGGFKLYNLLKEKLFPKTLWFLYLIPLALIVLLIGYRKKIDNNGFVILGIALAISSVILFNLPMLNSGLVDISRTMAIYNVVFDLIIFMMLCIFIYVTNKRKQEFKDKYGLSQ